MGFFKRFKKDRPVQPELPPPPPVEADTAAKLLFTRREVAPEEIEKAVAGRFGPGALVKLEKDHPAVTSFLVQIEGLEFWCAHMALPLPPEEGDLAELLKFSRFVTPEEAKALEGQSSFFLIVQKGAGTDLMGKRRACILHSRLCGALMELPGAAGYLLSEISLLLGPRYFLRHAGVLEREWQNPEYFPAPLWIHLYQGREGEAPIVGALGLGQFGFLDLYFYKPRQDWPEVFEKLYLMSIFQITGRELYRDKETIAFDPDDPDGTAIFKQSGSRLAVIGG